MEEGLNIQKNEQDPMIILSQLSTKERGDIQRAVIEEMMGEMDATKPIDKKVAWAATYGPLFDKALSRYIEQEHRSLTAIAENPTEHQAAITAIAENLHFLIAKEKPETIH